MRFAVSGLALNCETDPREVDHGFAKVSVLTPDRDMMG